MSKADRLFEIAREVANAHPEFHAVAGPGAGNIRNNTFVRAVQQRAESEFGSAHHEHVCFENTDLRADYYFKDEATLVEIALGLPNPNTEFEKDILKALIANTPKTPVTKLIFISRKGAEKKCDQPGRKAMIDWADQKQQLTIEIRELDGLARKRTRKPRARKGE